MTGSPPEWAPPGLDASRPSAARIQDALLGGGDHFEIDRMVADRLRQVVPQLSDVVTVARKLLRRAVRMLTERGVDQFLDLGAGLPTRDNTHDMAPGATRTRDAKQFRHELVELAGAHMFQHDIR